MYIEGNTLILGDSSYLEHHGIRGQRWAAKEENVASQKVAEKLGFKPYHNPGPGWTLYTYEHKVKHTSIGGTMYIEGNALILGDSSYLEHHGIRGQRWGVRRFQNRDGSLTNAGRKRLGYATKGAAQTVGKAFKAGVKAGGKAVKAVKAHHEKKEAEKLEKKKEKASKTRLGVMANKDLFTNEEIRKLNERFKLEDEMKMATLQKGVEIAKAVGTIAQNVGTVAKTYEDVTGQSLSPIKRKAAEEKARQDKEDRERRIAREDADEARKAAKEERDIAIHEQTLRKAIASADTQEFTAQKTKAEADSSILDLYKKGQDFNGGSDATGQSWMEKATSGGKNVFEQMKYDNDPEYRAAKDAHDAKVEQQRHEQERDARIASREKEAAAKQSPPQQKQGGGDDDALFSQKGSLPIDKDRYRNNRAMEKAKQVKEDAAEERAKKQDEKAVNRTIDDTIEANRSFKETVRAQDPHAYDRGVAKDYIKGKLNNLPNALADLNPINRAAKKIADKATKEEEAQVRKSMKDQYDQMVKNNGRDEANYVMYQTRVANLQQQGYSERKARQIADSNPTFSAKRNRKVEYSQKVKDLDDTHRKNAKEIDKANRELTDYYYKLVNGPGYEPGSPKREALDRKYRQKRGELERLEKDNNEMLENGTKEAKKILEHSISIQNGVLFIDSSDGLAHHGIRGQRWGVRRFQNPDGTRTEAGKKHDAKIAAKAERKQAKADMKAAKAEAKAKAKDIKLTEKAENLRKREIERYEKMADKHPRHKEAYEIMGKHAKESDRSELLGINRAANIRGTGQAIVGALILSTFVPTPIAVAGGVAIAKAMKMNNVDYARTVTTNARLNKEARERRLKEAQSIKIEHSSGGMLIQNGTLFINADEPYLEHHGVKGQRWGVRRFQNEDGSLTEKGRKHYEKKLAKAERKKVAADAARGYLERTHGFAVTSAAVLSGAAYAALMVASAANPATIALGTAVVAAMYGGAAHATYSINEAWEGRGSKKYERQANEYREMLKQFDMEEGIYHVENGTLFINAGEPYLEHHGVKGMKWGKHLMAGKGEAGAGGGSGEDDEKLKEMAKKAGMSVAEFRTKMAGKLSGAASKVGSAVYDAARPKDTRSFKQKAYDALGGKYKTQAAEAHKDMVYYKNKADDSARRANAQSRAVKDAKKKGAVQDYIANKEGARQLEKEAKSNRFAQWDSAKKANSAQWKYDHSIAGLYDKATGKYKQSHKKTQVPKLMDQAKYYYKEGSNNKLYNNGASKAKTAKEQAKAEVWKAADHVINSHDYYNQSYDPTVTAYGLDTAYRKEAVKYGRLAEGSYRRAAALGKQASNETSTSSRPRARKKKHTSGGSGVVVRRPGRKPVSRTKRVTQSSTGVKRRGATGSGRRVR